MTILAFAIVMTFANYVDAHAEEMRKSFVSHEGKKDLEVHVAGGNIVTVDWADIVKQFAGLVGVNTKSSVKEWIEPSFSTTTPNDRLIGGVALMGAMKNYFAFSVFIECGLPGVTLLGTLEDWKTIRTRADKLLEYATGQPDLARWHTILTPVLDEFVRAYQGQVDKEFWNAICNHIPGGSGPSYISGWINAFIPFHKGKYCLDQCPYFANPKDFKYGCVETGKVPTCAVEVPVKVDDNGREYKTLLYAGSIVASYNKETNRIAPSYDFALIDVTNAPKQKAETMEEEED